MGRLQTLRGARRRLESQLRSAGLTRRVLPGELVRLFQVGAPPAILDVRSQREYCRGHIPGAVNVAFNAIGRRFERVPEVADRPLVIYSSRGLRAVWARRALLRHGIVDVVVLEGHWPAWRRAGLPVVTGVEP